MAIVISRSLHDRLIALAEASPEVEICGFLLGDVATPGRIQAVEPAINVAEDARTGFEIDPAALFSALRRERAGGARVLGHYHSHPTGLGTPSPRDAAAAPDDGKLWLILGRRGAATEIGVWRSTVGGRVQGAFDPVDITIDG